MVARHRNADARHQTLDGREAVFLAVNIVESGSRWPQE